MYLIRFLISLIVMLGIAVILWTQTGPFAWVGSLQLASVGRYSVGLTLILTSIICLAPFFLLQFISGRARGITAPPGETCGGLYRSVSCGGLVASALILVFGLSPLMVDSPPIPEGKLHDTLARATLVPSQAKLHLTKEHSNIDLENQVSIGFRNSRPTIHAPIHEPGSNEVIGIVSGWENDWRNASIRATPFPNAANSAALEKAQYAVLTFKPVPYAVRRQLAAKGLPVAVFLPTFEWGRHSLAANLPLLIGGGFTFVVFLIAMVRTGGRDDEPTKLPTSDLT